MRGRHTTENKDWEEKTVLEKISDLAVIGVGLGFFIILPVYNIAKSLVAGKILQAGITGFTILMVWFGVLAMLSLFNGVRT